MTPKERELLGHFLQQLEQSSAGAKDAEAQDMILKATARQPDAGYLLVQRAMGLDLALQAAQAQITKLQAELSAAKAPAPAPSAGFLDNPNAWGRQAAPLGAQSPAARPFGAGTQAPVASAAPAPAAPAAPSAWGSGIMGTLATTAAGVVAGSLLYQGIQGLMGHHSPGFAGTPAAPSDPVPAASAAELPRDLSPRDEGRSSSDAWNTPDPEDQLVDDRTFLADAGDGGFGDDEYA